MNKYKLSCLKNIEIGDVFSDEFPKFESAHIISAENMRGIPLTDEELEWVNYESPETEKYQDLIYQEWCCGNEVERFGYAEYKILDKKIF